jgi:hypothetical protein
VVRLQAVGEVLQAVLVLNSSVVEERNFVTSPDLINMANGCSHQYLLPLIFVASAFLLQISPLAEVRLLLLKNYLSHFHFPYRYYSLLCSRGQAVRVLEVLAALLFQESGERPRSVDHWARLLLFLLWVLIGH